MSNSIDDQFSIRFTAWFDIRLYTWKYNDDFNEVFPANYFNDAFKYYRNVVATSPVKPEKAEGVFDCAGP